MLGWFKRKLKKEKKEEIALPEVELVQPDRNLLEVDENIDDVDLLPEEKEESPDDVKDTQDESLPLDAEKEDVVEKEIVTAATPVVEEKSKKSLFSRLKNGLAKTRSSLINRIDSVFLGKKEIDADLLDELEEILITADLGINTVEELLEESRAKLKRKELGDPEVLYQTLKEHIYKFLQRAEKPAEMVMPDQGPFVIMVLGVNGVGKTTTIGKLAHKFKKSGQSVLLVAADTFRAAAIDQLKIWAKRVGVEIIAQTPGADPSAVVFDALEHAQKRDYDVIIIDTAGRLHTKVNLMEELKKIKRVMTKKCPGAPHETMLVLDATTGQNAISQAREFHKAVDLTGLTMTKLDGTAKGGIVVNVSREFNIPIRFIGIGEQMDDLRDFNPKEFTEALFAK